MIAGLGMFFVAMTALHVYRPGHYVSHYGSAPISIVWKMHKAMPGFVLQEAVSV